MKRLAVLCLPYLLAGCVSAPRPAPEPADASRLVGTWKVDLRPTPSSPPYYQAFVVRSVDGKTFTGTFYGAEIRSGRINTDWNHVAFAFVTEDGSGAYHHSGRLIEGRLEGMTNSTGRDFLAVWTAARE
jgi:hypothetical protein